MSYRKLNKKSILITSLFFTLILGIIFNSAFFLHSHRTACGKYIVHAHPFNKSAERENPTSQHTHSKIDLLVFSSIDYYLGLDFQVYLEFINNLEIKILCEPFLIFYSGERITDSSRAPPTCII